MLDINERIALRNKKAFLVENLDVKFITEYLVQSNLLSVRESEEMLGKTTEADRVQYLLLSLNKHQLPHTFLRFTDVLKASRNDFIIDELSSELSRIIQNPTKEGDWLSHRLSKGSQQRIISSEELMELSDKVGEEWKDLGLLMGLSKGRLEQLQMQYPYDISQCVYTALHEWAMRNGSQASVTNFVNLCRQAGVDDLMLRDVVLGYTQELNSQSKPVLV